MADSPSVNATGVVDLSIKVGGTEMVNTGLVRGVEVEQCVNRICRANIFIEDGDMPKNTAQISDSDDFVPGAEIEILVGYNNQAKTSIFSGIVIRHGMKIDAEGQLLVVECFDKAISLTVGRKNTNFIDSKNSDVIDSILSAYGDVKKGKMQSSTAKFPELVQFNTTDWDFIISRAEVSGLVILNKDNTLALADPTDTTAVLDVVYGQDIISFDANIDAMPIYKSVTTTSWDLANQASVSTSSDAKIVSKAGNLSTDDLTKVINLKKFRLQSSTALAEDGLTEWASAQQVKSALAKIIGKVQFQGSSKVAIGDAITLDGLGKRFNGDVFVGGVEHTVENGDWLTTVSFGLEASWFTEKNQLQAPSAAGLLPGVEGLMVGKVLKLDGDPNNEQRIQISVPVLEAEAPGIWARICQPYASAGFGHFFMPEVDDEVVLGYFNNDPSNPVILGSVYSSKNAPPIELEAENNIKTLVTRCGHKFEFDDDKKIITLSTADGNQMILNDDQKSITIEDVNSNKVTLDSTGISLESPKDINLKATGDINLDATGNVSISAKADASIKALNVTAEAQVGVTAKGSATAELSASGQTTVKGGMVMIN